MIRGFTVLEVFPNRGATPATENEVGRMMCPCICFFDFRVNNISVFICAHTVKMFPLKPSIPFTHADHMHFTPCEFHKLLPYTDICGII
jgi:hypothetical protein